MAGTGFISDWFASWSDVFGGRSGTYQKQLRSLSDEAIAAVRAKAYELSANWIVGLTVDMDEISGQGKQMFMVTAMGTAVRATRARRPAPSDQGNCTAAASPGIARTEPSPASVNSAGLIPDEVVQAAARRYAVLDQIRSGQLVFDDETWATLLGDQIIEAAPAVIQEVGRLMATGIPATTELQQFRKQAVAYFERLPTDDAIAALYAALERTPNESNGATMLIKDLRLRHLPTIRRLLSHPTDIVRRRAIQSLLAEQRSYSPEDVAHLKAIAACCADETVLPPFATLSPGLGRGFFGAKDRLLCVCGTDRLADVEYCPNPDCQRDRWGFWKGALTSVKAREKCEALAVTLERVFAELGEQVGAPA